MYGRTMRCWVVGVLLGLLFSLLAGAMTRAQEEYHLYGGEHHDTYYGCLNCESYRDSTIWNYYSPYGYPLGEQSIWNDQLPIAAEGSAYSFRNPDAADPDSLPIVVDRHGKFYGYFTANKNMHDRWEWELLEIILDNYDRIVLDVDVAYAELFKGAIRLY